MIIIRIERDTLNSRNMWEISVVNDNDAYYIVEEYIGNNTKIIESVTKEFALNFIKENENFIIDICEEDYSGCIGRFIADYRHYKNLHL